MSHEEFQRKHQDPYLMVEEMEYKRQAEVFIDSNKQKQKEDTAKEKQFNEIFEKQLQNNGNNSL